MRALVAMIVAGLAAPAVADPKPSALVPDLVPAGKSWFCAPDGACTRERPRCSGDRCAEVAQAFVLTLPASATEPELGLAYATAAACAQGRGRYAKRTPEPSACVAIGATTIRPVTASDVPGHGWVCWLGSASGGCERTAEACLARQDPDGGTCAPAAVAYVSRVGTVTRAYPTLGYCGAAMHARDGAISTGCVKLE